MGATKLLGSVVAEMRSYACVLFLSGAALLAAGAVRDLPTVLISAMCGALTCCAPWWWLKWRPMLSNSVSEVQAVGDGAELELPKRTLMRGLLRISASYVPASIAMIVLGLVVNESRHAFDIGDGVLAGIWVALAVLYLAGAQQLRRWEVEHEQVIVRDMRRWRWSVSDAREGASGGGRFDKRRWCFVATQGYEGHGANLC
jgi:hypothetical protein